MPSGKTHDLITLSLIAPTAVAAWLLSGQWQIAVIATTAMLFGGLMFGPDLDLHSVQYSRWGPLRLIWLPYRHLFRHRSRLSHGLLLGTVIRIIYFLFMVTLVTTVIVCLFDIYLARRHPDGVQEFIHIGRRLWLVLRSFDQQYLLAAFLGAWWGAASHTLSDLIFTVGKQTGRIF